MEKGLNFEGQFPEQATPRDGAVPRPENFKKKDDSEEYQEKIKGLASQVSALMGKDVTYNGKNLNDAIRRVLGFSELKILSESEKKLMKDVKSELGRRGAEVANRKKQEKKRHIVPKGKTFTPAQIERMIAGSNKLQGDDEERAGQTWEDSDLEK